MKNPTDELTVHIFLTKVVGYFAGAQYDTLNLEKRRGATIGDIPLNYSAQ